MEPHEYAKAIFLAGCLGKPEVASALYEEMSTKGVLRTVEVENALMYVHAHAKGCKIDKALQVFQRLKRNTEDAAQPNLGSFNTALACHSKTQRLQHLEKTFDDMRQSGYLPSLETYNWLMLGYMRLGLWWRMEVVFSMMKASSCKPDGLTYRTLIRGYAAAQLTDRMQAAHGEILREGFELRSKTAEVMVAAYKKARDFPSMEKLLFSIKGKVFHTNMKKLKMRSYLCNSHLSAIDEIVDEALRNKELAFSPALADMVVRAYFKERCFDKLDKFLETIHAQGWNIKVSVYNTLLYLSGKFGLVGKTEHYFLMMLGVGCQPNATTFRIISTASDIMGEARQRILERLKTAGYDICKLEQIFNQGGGT